LGRIPSSQRTGASSKDSEGKCKAIFIKRQKGLPLLWFSDDATLLPRSNWIVMQQPIEISQNQIQQFANLISIDARPVQPLNNRFVLRSS
jgi:hypothetical protein